MRRKLLAAAVCAALALLTLIVLPTTSAGATTPIGGSREGCYGLKKKGYNAARLHVVGLRHNGVAVAGYASIAITRGCQRLNSYPFHGIQIRDVQLRTAAGRILTGRGSIGTTKHLSVSERTPFVTGVGCHTGLQVYEKVFYTYTNGAKVRAFWIRGPVFHRC